MNSKQICYLSSIIMLYIVSKTLFPVSLPFFPKCVYAMALLYPLIKENQRIFITILYQAINFFELNVFVRSFKSVLSEALMYKMSAPVLDNSVESPMLTMFFAVLKITQPGFYYGVFIGFFALGFIALLFEIGLFIALFTTPYSVYVILDKLGLYRLISKHTGNRFNLVN